LSSFLPYRPLLVFVSVGALYSGFHLLDKEEARACSPGTPCASYPVRRRMKLALWTATGLVMVFGTSPLWVRWIF
jgi:hypothetical protein